MTHAAERLKSRYGMDYTEEFENELVELISSDKRISSWQISTRKVIHRVDYYGREIKFLYSKKYKKILTFLPWYQLRAEIRIIPA